MAHENSRNKYDKKDSLLLGNRAEKSFVQLARRLGWRVSPSSKRQNIDEHWDYQIERDSLSFKVEVKSLKRIHREDEQAQSELTLVELHGVRPRDTGWLFGKADLIAFEKHDSFILVRKSDLLSVVNRKVDLVRKVREPTQALYKIYSRPGRKDKLTLLPMKDIQNIQFEEWRK